MAKYQIVIQKTHRDPELLKRGLDCPDVDFTSDGVGPDFTNEVFPIINEVLGEFVGAYVMHKNLYIGEWDNGTATIVQLNQ